MSGHPHAIRARGGRRRGIALVEILVAFVILGGALVAMARYTAQVTRTVTDTDARATASEIAADRLETVKGGTNYDTLDSLFAEPSPAPVPGHPRYRRRTLMQRVGGGTSDLMDYKVVTVIVTSSLLREPVRRTTVIGDF